MKLLELEVVVFLQGESRTLESSVATIPESG